MTTQETILAGGIAGGFASVFTNPIDVVKTNLMANKDNFFESYWHCTKFMYREDGFKVFFRGLLYRSFHVTLVSIVFFLGYEKMLNHCMKKIN